MKNCRKTEIIQVCFKFYVLNDIHTNVITETSFSQSPILGRLKYFFLCDRDSWILKEIYLKYKKKMFKR